MMRMPGVSLLPKRQKFPKQWDVFLRLWLQSGSKGQLNSDEADLLTSFLNIGLLKNSISISQNFKKKIDLYRSGTADAKASLCSQPSRRYIFR